MPKIVGINLGTTNSLVAAVLDGQPTILPDADGSRHCTLRRQRR